MKNGDTLRGPRSLSSNAVSAIPDRPPIPQPSGDTMPRPVTTTRLISSTPAHGLPPTTRTPMDRRRPIRRPCQQRLWASALCVLFEKLGGVADGQDGFRSIIWNLAAELFFK